MRDEEIKTVRLSDNIAAYDELRSELEMDHNGEWIVIHDRKISGYFESMQEATQRAVEAFGTGPYLIRQIGAPPITLPTSVLYQRWEPVRAPSQSD